MVNEGGGGFVDLRQFGFDNTANITAATGTDSSDATIGEHASGGGGHLVEDIDRATVKSDIDCNDPKAFHVMSQVCRTVRVYEHASE